MQGRPKSKRAKGDLVQGIERRELDAAAGLDGLGFEAAFFNEIEQACYQADDQRRRMPPSSRAMCRKTQPVWAMERDDSPHRGGRLEEGPRRKTMGRRKMPSDMRSIAGVNGEEGDAPAGEPRKDNVSCVSTGRR